MKELPEKAADEVAGGGLEYDQTEVLPLPAADYPQCPGPCTDAVTRQQKY